MGRLIINDFMFYLFRSACLLSGFAVVYFLFLRNERYFRLKRIFLLSGVVASLIFPLISIHYQVIMPAAGISASVTDQTALIVPGLPAEETNRGISVSQLFLMIYLTGLVIIAGKLVFNIFGIIRSIRRNPVSYDNTAAVIRTAEFPASFSFFKYVFINPSVEKNDMKEIMNHEMVHIKQKHWLDLMLAEFLRTLQWVNPFAWIYSGFIRQNHEYLADEVAIRRSADPAMYKAALLNQMFRIPVISLSNSFSYSINKNRFEMMKAIITSPYRKLRVLFIIPVVAIFFYAFAEPEVKYSGTETTSGVSQPVQAFSEPSQQKVNSIRGVVMNEEGKPFQGVQIAVTGSEIRGTTDTNGKFTLNNIPADAHIVFSCRGCITQVLKPLFAGEMTIKLLKDPEYVGVRVGSAYKDAIVVIDGVISEKPQEEVLRGIDQATVFRMNPVPPKEALTKYGDKGKNGAIEIMTRKKAAESGIKLPFRRVNPDDYPTFMGASHLKFSSWLSENIKFPPEAKEKGIKGRVTVTFIVQSDGTVGDPKIISSPDKTLGDAVIAALKSSPRWEPAKNPEAREPFGTSVTLNFDESQKVKADDVFVVVEQMPEYPGGDKALLDFIRNNTRYPEAARADKIEGKVIIRFVVNTKGLAEDAVVLKGIHPLLDAEALRVVNMLEGFLPGAQGGKPVNVWYMVPINFSISEEEKVPAVISPAIEGTVEKPDEEPQFPGGQQALLMAIAERTNYPQEAKSQNIQGRVTVRFIVNAEGKVLNPSIEQGVHPLLDAEAIKVVSALPDFKPGLKDGKPVATYYLIPITFTLR